MNGRAQKIGEKNQQLFPDALMWRNHANFQGVTVSGRENLEVLECLEIYEDSKVTGGEVRQTAAKTFPQCPEKETTQLSHEGSQKERKAHFTFCNIKLSQT